MFDEIYSGISDEILPEPANSAIFESGPHAPKRSIAALTLDERKLCVRNALRYFSPKFHKILAQEFATELSRFGHIYMHRFRPVLQMKAYPINFYKTRCKQAAAIMQMVMNNLDPEVAQYPQELVTYGGNGQVFSNWAQFRLVMHYLSVMSSEQSLVIYSGHPLGLFPSHRQSPRVVITNGMVIPNYSSKQAYDKMFAMGVTQYGQMTAGSYSYIGPQGIVHGTVITILNVARKYLKTSDLRGKVFVSAGLGGMSGAQAKATIILGCVGVIAEVSEEVLMKRHSQGWVSKVSNDLENCIEIIKQAKQSKKSLSLGYHGNVVDLWEFLVNHYNSTGELLVDLGSDQTSCHDLDGGGYCPVGLTSERSKTFLWENPAEFKAMVKKSILRHLSAINKLCDAGMQFWDYGNAFLLECSRAGASVRLKNDLSDTKFIYPSYVQDIMGEIFSLGFGPFRWICCSNDKHDLKVTDAIAFEQLNKLISDDLSPPVEQQYRDNIKWIENADGYNLVVGVQARILYCDQAARCAIAAAFNQAVADGRLLGPVVVSRDHHDVSGTDSPFRETSNIYDGSAFTADMAVQNFVGDAFRGATWVSLHNGGGVGWGEVINGGFGLVLDGSKDAENNLRCVLSWDVWNGVSRRSWAGSQLAQETIKRCMQLNEGLLVTLPNSVLDESLLDIVE